MEVTDGLRAIIHDFINVCPSGIAVVYDDMVSQEKISYKALSDKIKEVSAEISEYLNEGDYVCIHAQNSLEMICVLFSLIVEKAVCCPLDVSENDVFQVLVASSVKFAIVSDQILCANHDFKELLEKHVLIVHPITCLSDLVFVEIASKEMPFCLREQGIDFVVSSSGSTGHKKVIRVPGKCILPNISDLNKIFNLTSEDVIFMSSPLTFDASIVQIFISVIAKATLLIVPDMLLKQTGNMCKILFERNQTTILQATPSLVQLLGNFLIHNRKSFSHTSLRVLCLGAEPFPPKSELKKLIGKPKQIEVYNIYGISEVSSWASIERVDLFAENLKTDDPVLPGTKYPCKPPCDDETKLFGEVSIGCPLTDTKIELRSESGTAVCEGYGEIWIGGRDRVCLIGDEKESLQNTMRPSGDIGLKKNDKIYYIRRKDNQVKILGKFVDLEQIEHLAEEIDAVSSSICIYSKKKDMLIGNLILFLAIKEGLAEKDVKISVLSKINSRLPRNGLFLRCVFLKEVPLSSHFKKDRLKLQRMVEDSPPEINFSEFANFDDFLLSLFESVIHWQSNDFNMYDKRKSFIENGGDSFSALFLESQICEYFRFLSNDDVKFSLLYDRIISSTFEELIEHLKMELGKREEQGFFYRKSDYQEVTGQLEGELERLEPQSDPLGRVERQEMVPSQGRSYSEMAMKEVGTSERCTCWNKKYRQVEDTEFHLSRNDWSFVQARKRKHAQCEQKRADAKQNFVESSLSIANHRPFLCQTNHQSKFWPDEIYSSEGTETDPKTLLNSREVAVKGDLISINHDTSSGSNCDLPLYNCNSNSTMQCAEDPLFRKNVDIMDCYCSVTRGSKYSVCDCCISRGFKSACPSIVTNLTVESLTLIKKNWVFDTSKCVDASPLIVCSGDHFSCIVYIGSHSHFFYAINTDDGSVVWKIKLGDRVESSAAISKDGKTIIVGCYDHYIYVISRRHGNTLWQLKTGESVKCSPVVSKVSGFAFIGSHDHHMYAIDTQKLSQIWCTYCGGGSVFGSPAFSGDFKLLFVGTLGSNLVAIDSENGVVKWKLTMDRPIFTSPLCIDDDICFCCVDGYVHFVASSGCLRWSLKIPGPIFSSPSVAPSFDVTRFVLGSHDKAVYCISNGGELKWRTQLDSPIFATPTVVPRKGNLCDGFCEEKGSSAEFLVFVCSTDGKLYVLNFGDGTIVKTHVFSNEVFSSPVVFGSSMVVGCRDNNVYCLSL